LIVCMICPIVLHNTLKDGAMKEKVIHCRVTEDQHKAIKEAADQAGMSITNFVVRAAISRLPPASHSHP
jgi:predicted HicB family RNase H-like nuclease